MSHNTFVAGFQLKYIEQTMYSNILYDYDRDGGLAMVPCKDNTLG